MSEKQYDLLVIGGGIGGYSAALRASKYGMKAAIVEKSRIGGTCLNRGCIPTKHFLHIAKEKAFAIREQSELISDSKTYEDFEYRINENVSVLQKGLSYSLDVAGVEVFYGTAVVKGDGVIAIAKPERDERSDSGHEETLRYTHLIIATGSKPFIPKGIQPGENIFTTDNAFLASNMVSDSIAVIGGGVIGAEFASIYADLGKKVTIIEAGDALVPGFSRQLSKFVRLHLQRKGVVIKILASVSHISDEDGEVYIELSGSDHKETMLCDKALICTGRIANIDETLASKLGIEVENGLICVDKHYRTSNNKVYAVGDVSSEIQLAYTASRAGEMVVDHIYGSTDMEPGFVPQCIYMDTEVAQVGIVIDDENDEYITEKYSFKANSMAVLEGKIEGFVRLTAEKRTGILTGVEMVSPCAVESIQLCKLLVDKRSSLREVSEMVFPHPSYIEAIRDSARLLLCKMGQEV